jgi:LmbE family N-acetylglucosaminyl deacetylase
MSDNRHLEDTHEVAVEAWRVAEERAAELRAAWREAGSPATTVGGSNGRSLVAHPLLEAVERAEKHAARLREDVRKRHRGPSPRAHLGVIGLSKSAKLREARGGRAG